MSQEAIKDELISRSEVYFNSVESLFKYRERHIWKYNVIVGIKVFVDLLFFSTIFPFLPYGFKHDITNWLGDKLVVKSYIIPLNNFFFLWLLLSIVSFFIFLIFYFLKKFYKKSNDKYSISSKQLRFAYIALCVKELKLFLINDRSDSIEIATKYLKKYYKISDGYLSFDTEQSNITDHLLMLSAKRFWIHYTESTQNVINAFKDFDSKIFRRLDQKEDIDQIIDWLSNLLIYEYLKIKKVKPDQPLNTDKSIVQLREIFFYDFCDCINIAQSLEIQIQENDKSKISFLNKIISFFENVSCLFTHKTALITFACWLILLSSLFIPFLYFGMQIFNLKVDSTILISSISAIMVCTITITATVYSKKNN